MKGCKLRSLLLAWMKIMRMQDSIEICNGERTRSDLKDYRVRLGGSNASDFKICLKSFEGSEYKLGFIGCENTN